MSHFFITSYYNKTLKVLFLFRYWRCPKIQLLANSLEKHHRIVPVCRSTISFPRKYYFFSTWLQLQPDFRGYSQISTISFPKPLKMNYFFSAKVLFSFRLFVTI